MSAEWHVPDGDLRRYAGGESTPPMLWSTEAHLAACADCRARLTAVTDPEILELGWARLDAELDAPVPGPIERLLLRCGVADHTARLLVATPVLRISWLIAVASTLALTIALANLVQPVVFLAVAPLLPLAGVAASYGRGVDPTYEVAIVAPLHTFRLLLLRTAAVLTTTTVLSVIASIGLPEEGLRALGWFLPALALTLLSLALTPAFGPVGAAVVVGLAWAMLVIGLGAGSFLLGPGGQSMVAVAALLAATMLVRLRPAFDLPRDGGRSSRLVLWRRR
ncbi:MULTISPECIES: hypothetical protein [Polymorphospora]|uniref:Zf-HC2 domain-containing protein n=1 Tax=Polymorphospora lycopeni TaxID=3140240 RepID=A0ABV5CXK4_9ACTN